MLRIFFELSTFCAGGQIHGSAPTSGGCLMEIILSLATPPALRATPLFRQDVQRGGPIYSIFNGLD
jgi:hypothetical protein